MHLSRIKRIHTYTWLLTVPHSPTVHTTFVSNAVLLWVSALTKRCTKPEDHHLINNRHENVT